MKQVEIMFKDRTIFDSGQVVDDCNTIGNNCVVKSNTRFGNANKFGAFTNVRDYVVFGIRNNFGNCNSFGSHNTIGFGSTLGIYNTFKDGNTFGGNVSFGSGTKLGDDNTLGRHPEIGDAFKFGKRLMIDGMKVLKLMHIANAAGSGRRVMLVFHTEGVYVYSGCFGGTLRKFYAEARKENKLLYISVVKALVRTIRAHIKAEGITGGWDEAPDSSSIVQGGSELKK